ncbi:MAG: DUF4290 domain-containing protein [Chitinophagaceae bacterium]
MEYNTTRTPLTIREYGRHIQKMVDYLLVIEDAAKRQEQAEILIELMGFLNPHLKNVEDFRHKLWDHLFYMSDFRLQVESPYPIPTREEYNEKPAPLAYPQHKPKYAHLGRNLELLIAKAKEESDTEKKEYLVNNILYYIKLAYSNWHKEYTSDEAIANELRTISGGALSVDEVPQFKYKPDPDKEDGRIVNGNVMGNTSSSKKAVFSAKSSSKPKKASNNGNNRNNAKASYSFAGGFKKKYK